MIFLSSLLVLKPLRFALSLTFSCQKALHDGKANHTGRLTRLDTQQAIRLNTPL